MVHQLMQIFQKLNCLSDRVRGIQDWYISGITSGLDNFANFPFKVLESYSKELSNTDIEKYKNNKNNLFNRCTT